MDRRRDPAVPEDAVARAVQPQRSAPMVEQVLAMQRGAGNAAVGRMLSRFYEDTGDGSATWHPGEPGPQWVATGKKYYWLGVFPYPLYAPKSEELEPEAEAEEETAAEQPEATKGRRRAKRKKKRPKAPAQQEGASPAPETPPQDATAPAQGQETATPEQPAPAQQQADDGFVSGNRRERKAAIRQQLPQERVHELIEQLNGFRGTAQQISTPFNELFNLLSDRNELSTGTFNDAYISNWDTNGFSVEVAMPGLSNWVIHAHLDRDGNVSGGPSPIHYKHINDTFAPKRSVALTRRQVQGLLPGARECLEYARQQTAGRPAGRRVDW